MIKSFLPLLMVKIPLLLMKIILYPKIHHQLIKRNLKELQRLVRGLGRPIISPVNETSEDLPVCKVDTNKSKQYNNDEEDLPLRPVRPRTNSETQELKGLNDTSTNVNNTDDENLPLKH